MFEHVRKTVLIVLFIPSVERDGRTGIEQEAWKSLRWRDGVSEGERSLAR